MDKLKLRQMMREKASKAAGQVSRDGIQKKKKYAVNVAALSKSEIFEKPGPVTKPSKSSVKPSSVQVETTTPATTKSNSETEVVEDSNLGSDHLPTGFFDEKRLGKEYMEQKAVQQQEQWDKFKKEMAFEVKKADEVMQIEDDEAEMVKEVREIDEQIDLLERVAQMKKRRLEVLTKKAPLKKNVPKPAATAPADHDESEHAQKLDDLVGLNWRAKQL